MPPRHTGGGTAGRPRRTAPLLPALACAWLLPSCGPGDTVEITLRRVVSAGADPVLPDATSDQRFGRAPAPSADDHDHDHDHEPTVAWELPEGWEVLPAGGVALVSLRPAGEPDALCTITLLGGSGGGLAANVNRWRDQLGLAPIDEAAVAALPRVPVLGTMATVVELRGAPPEETADPESATTGLMGLIVPVEGSTLFVKMTGPVDVLAAEGRAFEAFCHSLRVEHPSHGEPEAAPSSSLRYTVPPGWRDRGPREMREVDLQVGDETECYVVVLSGEAGGLLPNLNRWRNEVGLEPIGEEEAQALERVSLLGVPSPLLDVSASPGEADGTDVPGSERSVLGALLIGSGRSVFVKMVGPRAEVSAHRDAFRAFCSSLEEAR